MSEKNDNTAPPLSPEQQQQLAQINKYVTALNDYNREFNNCLKQIATEYGREPGIISYFGKTTITVACAMLYRLIPDQFNVSLEEIEQYVQVERDLAIVARQKYLHTMPYADYLLTPHWQNMRQGALERAQYRCQVCNASKSLHAHHRTYERRGHENQEDLIVLCENCHKLFHDNGKLVTETRGE
jgi:hypothetical protein